MSSQYVLSIDREFSINIQILEIIVCFSFLTCTGSAWIWPGTGVLSVNCPPNRCCIKTSHVSTFDKGSGHAIEITRRVSKSQRADSNSISRWFDPTYWFNYGTNLLICIFCSKRYSFTFFQLLNLFFFCMRNELMELEYIHWNEKKLKKKTMEDSKHRDRMKAILRV